MWLSKGGLIKIQTQPKKTNILSARGSYSSPNLETRLYFLAINP